MHDLVCERARGFAQYHVLAVDRDLASLHISSRSVVKLLVVQLELGRGIGDFDLGRIETKLARDLIDGALVEQVLTAPLLSGQISPSALACCKAKLASCSLNGRPRPRSRCA